jgi:hypothetical protein
METDEVKPTPPLQMMFAVLFLFAIVAVIVWGAKDIGRDIYERLNSETKLTDVSLPSGTMIGETIICAARTYSQDNRVDYYLDCSAGTSNSHALDVTFIGKGPKDKAYFWMCKREQTGLTCRVK